MLAKSSWQHLIPHRDVMCLLDTVVAFDGERLHAQSDSHRASDNPLRADGLLRAVHLAEYGAQAMAVHGGLLAVQRGDAARPGLLVALRQVHLAVARLDDLPAPLDVHVEKLLDGGTSWQYAFHIDCAARRLADGRAAVMVGDDGGRS